MKRASLLFLLFPAAMYSQIRYDFESGNIKSWEKSRESAWCISPDEPIRGSYSLRHNLDDSISGEDRISFSYDSLVLEGTTSWEFLIRHGYPPSSSNKWAVFLVSDSGQENMSPSGKGNAFILGVNFTGSDDILKLWRRRGNEISYVAVTGFDWQENVGTGAAKLKVMRFSDGEWNIFTGGEPGTGNDTILKEWEFIGKGSDTSLVEPEYFGVCYRFSSRQDLKLWIDDILIKGTFLRDTLPPSLKEINVLDQSTLRLRFSETLNTADLLDTLNYKVGDPVAHPFRINIISGNILELKFRVPFASGGISKLTIRKITDPDGNRSENLIGEFTWYEADRGDIIFNEIMFDPEPVIGLPAYEYIELSNRTGYSIGLRDWTLQIGSRRILIPDFKIQAGNFLLLCYKGTTGQYNDGVNKADILPSRSLLKNDGGSMYLLNGDSVLMDAMEYHKGLHLNDYYASGGWSLERIDPDRVCFDPANWTSSKCGRGGSPGIENSIMQHNPDMVSPEVLGLYVPDSSRLVIEFSESMDPATIHHRRIWDIIHGPGIPENVEIVEPFNRELRLEYPDDFIPGRDYYLDVPGSLKDCSGNLISGRKRFRFAIPLDPGPSDVLISEVLFNPPPYCPDFVEIYNPGPCTFNLADILLGSRDPVNREIEYAGRVTDKDRLLFPGEFIALTVDPSALKGYYSVHNQGSLLKTNEMPTFGDKEGTVLLLDKYLEVLDEFPYHRELHHPALRSKEGVSLERISYSVSALNPSNWHSASSLDGYATPGRRNSQYRDTEDIEAGFEAEPEIFSPDLDGIDDILLIKYRFNIPGLTARIMIFDPGGRLIKAIGGKQLLGTKGFFSWDGTDGNGKMARSGIYLIFAEVYGAERRVSRYRIPVVLSR
jgi:hypothetical protein